VQTGPARPRSRTPSPAWIALIAGLVAAGLWRGALGYWFCQDDFAWLARARGLLPPAPFPWRWLSCTALFAMLKPLGIDSAVPYHALSVAALAACAALLGWLLARRFHPLAALVGAVFFAAHPAHFNAAYWVSAIGDIFALLFGLIAIALARVSGRSRWLALAAFACALLSKESVALLPLALAVEPGWLEARGKSPNARAASSAGRYAWVRRLDPIVPAMLALSVAFSAALLARDVFGTRAGVTASAPYALSFGPHVLTNFAAYTSWSVNLFVPGGAFLEERAVLGWSALVVPVWLAGLAWPRLRAAGWLAGGVTFTMLLLPVLGLRNHTYHYYLCAPLAGAAWCLTALVHVACGIDRSPAPGRTGRRGVQRSASAPGRAALPWISGALALALALSGAARIREIETMPMGVPELRSNPIVDRARIARRLVDGLRAAQLPPGARLVLRSPSSLRFERQVRTGTSLVPGDTYWDRSVRAAVMEDLALRMALPQLSDVTFRYTRPAIDTTLVVALYDPDGSVRVLPAESWVP
jgi:hypothetical protein